MCFIDFWLLRAVSNTTTDIIIPLKGVVIFVSITRNDVYWLFYLYTYIYIQFIYIFLPLAPVRIYALYKYNNIRIALVYGIRLLRRSLVGPVWPKKKKINNFFFLKIHVAAKHPVQYELPRTRSPFSLGDNVTVDNNIIPDVAPRQRRFFFFFIAEPELWKKLKI